MKTVENIISAETAMALRQVGILESKEPSPTITDCVVWFANHGIAIITDYNDLDNEWKAMACVEMSDRQRRYGKSYIEVMNAAIRDAAKAYAETNH